MREGRADRTKPRPDRFDWDVKETNYERGHDQRHERSRNASAHARPQRHNQQGRDRYTQRLCVDRVKIGSEGAPLRNELRRQRAHAQSQKILHLTREDDDRDSAGESDYDGMRNELDRRAELGDAEHDEYQASHNGRDDEAVDPVSLDDSVNDYDECAGRSADLNAGAAKG